MANLFKGFKQVLGTTYAQAVKDGQAAGYIWFVRTPAGVEGVTTEGLKDDVYDIYFGTKHYGHFADKEISNLEDAIKAIDASVGLGADHSYESVHALLDGATTVNEAIEALAAHVQADIDELASYKETNDAKVAKRAVDVVYAKANEQGADGQTHAFPALYLKLADNSYTTAVNVNDFITDGMIESVEFDESKNVIRFKWNTDSGSKITEIPIADFYKPLTQGNGITISGQTISAKVKDADEYLTVGAEGIASKGINEVVKTQNIIKPIGVTVGNISASNPIPKGKTLEEVLKMMLQKTIGIAVASNPSVSMETSVSGGNKEKGTKVNPTFTVTFKQGSYKGAESGYSYSASTVCAAETPTMVNGGVANEVTPGSKWTFTPGEQVITETKSFEASITYGDDTNSGLKNNMGETVPPQVKGKTLKTDTVTYTPQVKWFIGGSNDKYSPDYWTSEKVRALTNVEWATAGSTKEFTFKKGAKQQVVAIPATMDFNSSTKMITNNRPEFTAKSNISFTNAQGYTESYNIWVSRADDGLGDDSTMTITLK